MSVKVAINGFGRIGRNVLRAALAKKSALEFVAVNDLTDAETLAHLFRYDSVHGRYEGKVEAEGEALLVDGKKIQVLSIREGPKALPWGDLGVEVVIEATGLFLKKDLAEGHLASGAKKVILTAPAKGDVPTFCMGVNESSYDPKSHHVLSNASCTTNCLAPVAKVLHENFSIRHGLMTTIHSYTNDQRILDLPHKDLRRARAAALSMIPTSTGAAKAVGLVLPALKGKLDGMAVRVPTPNVSLVDFVAEVEKPTDAEAVNAAFKKAADGKVLAVSEEPLVSCDYNGTSASSTVDLSETRVLDGTMVKVLAWYDNEWGYSNRVVDLAEYVASKGL